MKKVAFVISTLDLGGAQRAVSSITLGLPDDYSIDIILNDDSNIVYPYKGRVLSLGMKSNGDRTNLWYQSRVFIKRIKYLKKLKKTNSYDAVVSFLDSANIANILSGKKYCKTIVSVRVNLSQEKSWKYRFIVSNFANFFYKKSDLIVSLSEGVRSDLIKNYNVRPNQVVTIYNGYDVDQITYKSKEASIVEVDPQKINFVTMGRLTHQKGQWHLIRAFAELYKKYKNIKLFILGIGELEDYLRTLIKEYQLEGAVILVGFVNNSYAVLAKMDVFVFPSLYEGFGNAIVEAMACGLPCISTYYESGAKEILMNPEETFNNAVTCVQYGIAVSTPSGKHYNSKEALEDAEIQLKDAMALLINNEDLRKHYTEKSKERADYFSLKKSVYEWDKII